MNKIILIYFIVSLINSGIINAQRKTVHLSVKFDKDTLITNKEITENTDINKQYKIQAVLKIENKTDTTVILPDTLEIIFNVLDTNTNNIPLIKNLPPDKKTSINFHANKINLAPGDIFNLTFIETRLPLFQIESNRKYYLSYKLEFNNSAVTYFTKEYIIVK